MSKPTQDEADSWTILRTEVGSRVLGVAVEGTDDRDLLAIAVEPPAWVIGLKAGLEQPRAWQYRTQPDGVRSGVGDIDLTVHPLRKWMRLALGGNPTVLMSLYAPAEAVEVSTYAGDMLRRCAPNFVSERARKAFSGYLTQQARGLTGDRKTHTNRPELVEQYGYDTKFAYHAVRLGIQGIQFITEGKIILPMLTSDREWLLDIRHGRIPLEDVLEQIRSLHDVLSCANSKGGIPTEPDSGWAERFLVSVYLEAWKS